ncbi:MAG: carboxypeptidase-like regulatory domain-containing protein, partial [Anaerolineae bacterium]
MARPARPGPLNPYIYPGDPTVVTVSDGQRLTGVNFTLIPADATIQGTIVDGDGNPVAGASGWITARSTVSATIHNGAPISNSLFAVPVPAGTYNVLARLSPGGDYVSAGARQVTVAAGETANVTLVVQAKDAAIQGALYDPRNLPAGVANVNGIAGAWSDNNWAIGPIAAGLYRFDVAAGLWFLDYRLDPTAGYAKLSRPKSVPVQSGKTRTVNLPVTVKDGLITGTVKSPDGSPLGGALVVAKGFEGDVSNLWLNTLSEGDGRFALPVPNGSYRLGAAIGNPAWLKPGEAVVTVPEGETSGGHVLQFRLPNATLSGTLAVSNAVSGGPAFVWAWSDDGAFTHSVFTVTLAGNQASGPYQLPVISGTTWHVGARFETGSQYWGGEADIAVNAVAAVQDIVLSGPNPKPGPVAVLFNAADEQSLTLADGTEIFIPAGAIPVSGNVLLRVEPISAVPAQTNMRVVNYGYAFLASDETGLPIEEHFNQDVTIRFTYD